MKVHELVEWLRRLPGELQDAPVFVWDTHPREIAEGKPKVILRRVNPATSRLDVERLQVVMDATKEASGEPCTVVIIS